MRFRRPDNGVVELSAGAVATLTAYRQAGRGALEAGGVLLGRHILGSGDIVIDRVSEPGPVDRRSRYWFRRAKKPAQQIVDRAWRESKGVINYLGDWHSHPEDDPTPSCVDRRDWKKITRRVKCEAGALFFIIVGIRHICMWEVDRRDLQIRPLEVVDGNGDLPPPNSCFRGPGGDGAAPPTASQARRPGAPVGRSVGAGVRPPALGGRAHGGVRATPPRSPGELIRAAYLAAIQAAAEHRVAELVIDDVGR